MTRGALVCTAALTLLIGEFRGRPARLAAFHGRDLSGNDRLDRTGRRTRYDLRLLRAASTTMPTRSTTRRCRKVIPREQWSQTLQRIATLDLSLATQLIDRSYAAMASVRGLGEVLVRSSQDRTMQPVAVYVPSGYAPARPTPLIVLLHGHPQSETQLLAPLVHRAARRSQQDDRRRSMGTRLLRFSRIGIGRLRRAATPRRTPSRSIRANDSWPATRWAVSRSSRWRRFIPTTGRR